MEKKIKLSKYTLLVTCILIGLCVHHPIKGQQNSDVDLIVTLEQSELICYTETSVSSLVYVNSTLNLSDPIMISGSWLGNQQPNHIQVNLSNNSGIVPFTSMITFQSTSIETGTYLYQITFSSEDISYHKEIQLQVKYNYSLSFETDKDRYEKGQKIHINGTVSTNSSLDSDPPQTISLNISQNDFLRSILVPLENNSFNYSYGISYGDPEGLWNVTVKISDDQGNTGIKTKNITIAIPPDIVRYKVVWYSPPEEAMYTKGSTFNISIFVTENDIGVINASTNCTTPSMESIALTEIKQGYYQQAYTIPYNSKSGTWMLSVESIKGIDTSLKAGGSHTPIIIKPATLLMNVIEPSSDEYNINDNVPFNIKLRYPDKSIVSNAFVCINTLEESIPLDYLGNGTYSGSYSSAQKEEGNLIVDIIAEDPYGNDVTGREVIYFLNEEKNEFPILTIISIGLVIVIGIIVIFLFKKYRIQLHTKDVKSEIEEIEKLQKESIDKYYIKGSISREAYDSLQKDYTQRLTELKKDGENIHKDGFKITSHLNWRKNR